MARGLGVGADRQAERLGGIPLGAEQLGRPAPCAPAARTVSGASNARTAGVTPVTRSPSSTGSASAPEAHLGAGLDRRGRSGACRTAGAATPRRGPGSGRSSARRARGSCVPAIIRSPSMRWAPAQVDRRDRQRGDRRGVRPSPHTLSRPCGALLEHHDRRAGAGRADRGRPRRPGRRRSPPDRPSAVALLPVVTATRCPDAPRNHPRPIGRMSCETHADAPRSKRSTNTGTAAPACRRSAASSPSIRSAMRSARSSPNSSTRRRSNSRITRVGDEPSRALIPERDDGRRRGIRRGARRLDHHDHRRLRRRHDRPRRVDSRSPPRLARRRAARRPAFRHSTAGCSGKLSPSSTGRCATRSSSNCSAITRAGPSPSCASTELLAETLEYLIELSGARVESRNLTHGVVITDAISDEPRLSVPYPSGLRDAKRSPLLFDGIRSVLIVDQHGRARTELQANRPERLHPSAVSGPSVRTRFRRPRIARRPRHPPARRHRLLPPRGPQHLDVPRRSAARDPPQRALVGVPAVVGQGDRQGDRRWPRRSI